MSLRFHLSAPVDRGAQLRLGNTLARHLAAANMLGRIQIVRAAHRKTQRVVPISTWSRLTFDDTNPTDLLAGFGFDLPGDDAAGYIRDLTPVTRQIFDGLSAQYKKDAFTLAGAADVRLIEKIRDELASVAQGGGTVQEFEAAVNALTDEAGMARLDAFTLDTAFNTAMQRAYSLGRYEQMSDPAVTGVLPYWQYWTVGDLRVRPEHAVLDGFTARAEDPVWLKIYPPNGFNCRCSVVSILASEAPDNSDEPGMMRLPALAQLLVPQPGFSKVFAA